MNYHEKKAKLCYELYRKGKNFKKVYAVVEKEDKYMVLDFLKSDGSHRYDLSGGGVDKTEDNITAIHRELLEEMNINVEIIKSLGTISYPTNRKYKDKEFELICEAEIFLTRFVSYSDHKSIGLDGEFNSDTPSVSLISRETMLETVDEFKRFGIKLD